MAQVHQKDDLLVVQYVTGPQHVWLGVRFSREPAATTIVTLPPVGDCSHGKLDQDLIANAVFAAADEHGLHVVRIEYIANDSPNYQIYLHCARQLAKYAASGAALNSLPTSK